ncbi:MAG: hypothetical protein ACP5NF_06215 [Thermoanaerobaculum sp.]
MRWLLSLSCLFLASCATLRGPDPDFGELAGEAPAFRAAYQLECCGLRGLLLMVGHGRRGTLVEVAAGPGGVELRAWVEGDRVVERTREGCVRAWEGEGFPLPSGQRLPVSEPVLASLLAGRVPAGGTPQGERMWIVPLSQGRLALELAGGPSRWVNGTVGAGGEEKPVKISARAHHGKVPGELRVTGAFGELKARLVEFRPVEDVPPPRWLSLPRCGGL